MTRRQMPSAAQARVLEAMRDGATMLGHPDNGAGLFKDGRRTDVMTAATHRALIRAGWVRKHEQWVGRFDLTALGRHALEAALAAAKERA